MTAWPRIGPFLDGLLAEDMPYFAIRVGCEAGLKELHPKFYDLVGLENVTLIGGEPPVFAREVIVPTEGIAHSPLLNYWNVVAMRQKVLARLGPIGSQKTKQCW